MPIEQRVTWDFYLDRFGTPFNRSERMMAVNSYVSSQNPKAKLEDFILPKYQEAAMETDFEKGQTMLAKMAAHNGN